MAAAVDPMLEKQFKRHELSPQGFFNLAKVKQMRFDQRLKLLFPLFRQFRAKSLQQVFTVIFLAEHAGQNDLFGGSERQVLAKIFRQPVGLENE